MPDFHQTPPVTTLHDFGAGQPARLEELLAEATREKKIGLVLPVTAADMRAPAFARIVEELQGAAWVDQICVTLGAAPEAADFAEARALVAPLGDRAEVLWTDGGAVRDLLGELRSAGLPVAQSGKGLGVWAAFGYLLGDTRLAAFALHDCDIVDYDRTLLARLCLPMVHPSLDFEFAKAFYHRATDRLYGRVTRLFVGPLLHGLLAILGRDPFLLFLASLRYPLAGEFAVTAGLARSNRIPGDWGLEIGTLAEVFRNTSLKRVCQVDLGIRYEHKHQPLAPDAGGGLVKMAAEILGTLLRTLASRGVVVDAGRIASLQAAYLRAAQDSIRQYHADALVNGLEYDRHEEEQAVESFARQIRRAGDAFLADPVGGSSLPNWARVLTAFPDLPKRLRSAARAPITQAKVGRGS